VNKIESDITNWIRTFEEIISENTGKLLEEYETEEELKNNLGENLFVVYESRYPKKLAQWASQDFCCVWPCFAKTMIEPLNRDIVATSDVFRRTLQRIERDAMAYVQHFPDAFLVDSRLFLLKKKYIVFAEMTSFDCVHEMRERVKVMSSFFNQRQEWVRYHNWYFITQNDLLEIFDTITLYPEFDALGLPMPEASSCDEES